MPAHQGRKSSNHVGGADAHRAGQGEWSDQLYLELESAFAVAQASAARPVREAPWALAGRALRRAIQGRAGGAAVEVGYVKLLGSGLSSEAFVAEVEIQPDPGRRSGAYVASVPRHEVGRERDERVLRELAVLSRLGQLTLPFVVPESVGAVREGGRLVAVRQFLRGIPLPPKVGRLPGVSKPWEDIAQVAAAIHAIDPLPFQGAVPAHPTRRAHAEAELAVFEGLDGEFAQARAWALAHLPPAEPARLLHGDLLPQNILLGLEKVAVIDWEFACLGDPAYDLAIVTRGKKQPFGASEGLRALLEAYVAAGGTTIRPAEVHLYELCLQAHLFRSPSAQEHGRREARDCARAVLRRAQTERA